MFIKVNEYEYITTEGLTRIQLHQGTEGLYWMFHYDHSISAVAISRIFEEQDAAEQWLQSILEVKS